MVCTHFQRRPSAANSYYSPRGYPCTLSGVLHGGFWGCFNTFSMLPGYHVIGCVRGFPGYRDTDDNMGSKMNEKVIWNVK